MTPSSVLAKLGIAAKRLDFGLIALAFLVGIWFGYVMGVRDAMYDYENPCPKKTSTAIMQWGGGVRQIDAWVAYKDVIDIKAGTATRYIACTESELNELFPLFKKDSSLIVKCYIWPELRPLLIQEMQDSFKAQMKSVMDRFANRSRKEEK